MKLAYADPPYPGRAHLYADHPDYAGEVDHNELVATLSTNYDGWALSTSAAALPMIFEFIDRWEDRSFRTLAWVKHTVTIGWEPVVVVAARPVRGLRDWIQVEPDSYQWRPKPESYVIGQKPEAFCRWVFEWMGAEPDDELDDLFPGSGNVGHAWEGWRSQPGLFMAQSPAAQKRAARRAEAKQRRTAWTWDS